MARYLSQEETLNVLSRIKSSGMEYSYDYSKHKVLIMDDTAQEAFQLRLPVTISWPEISGEQEVEAVSYIIVLIRSGSGAVAFCKGQEMLDHKVFKSYMVRKKQGKSQIKYLKTKGKSKAGSRVRLGNALSFFEDINERMQEYFEDYSIDRVCIGCSKTLIPYLYNSKVAPPFDKRDERIFKIPKHIHTPGYDVLVDTHKFLQKGEVIYSERDEGFVKVFLGG